MNPERPATGVDPNQVDLASFPYPFPYPFPFPMPRSNLDVAQAD